MFGDVKRHSSVEALVLTTQNFCIRFSKQAGKPVRGGIAYWGWVRGRQLFAVEVSLLRSVYLS